MDFYEQNYKDFSSTRHNIWDVVVNFSKNFKSSDIILDAGCGNGKNMTFIKPKVKEIQGFDSCQKFVSICKDKGLNVISGDVRDIPYPDEAFDYIICIAVIHHLKSHEERKKSVCELLRVLKPGGKLLFTCWAYESDEFSTKRKFTRGDNNVLFNGQDRYYYVYDKTEFVNFCGDICANDCIFWERGNWNTVITKI